MPLYWRMRPSARSIVCALSDWRTLAWVKTTRGVTGDQSIAAIFASRSDSSAATWLLPASSRYVHFPSARLRADT